MPRAFGNEGNGHEATELYRQNRDAMDVGSVVAWPERYNQDELSAIQHAMNLKFRDEAAFFAEYQNEPLLEEAGDGDLMTADQVAAKFNRLRRGEVPIGGNHLTMFIDVQAACCSMWSPPGRTTSLATFWITAPIPTRSDPTSPCGTPVARWRWQPPEPAWKARSTPVSKRSLATTSAGNGDATTGLPCGSSGA